MPLVLRRIALLLASVLVTLAAAEAVLRVAGFGRITPEMNFGVNTRGALERGGFEPNDDLFWTLPAKATPADEAIGAVHPKRVVPPKGRKLRLVVLGDSCSRLSAGGPLYSERLARALGPMWDVRNAAVPGYTTWQGLAWLRTQLLGLEPDLVVVYFGWNDHWRATGVTDSDYAASRRGGLRLAGLLRRTPHPAPPRVPLDEYRANLDAITNEIAKAGGQAIVVAAPAHITAEARARLEQTGYILPDEDPVALHESYLTAVHALAGRKGVAVLAADRLFAELEGGEPLMMRDGIHLTDRGHAAMAAALLALITTGAGADGSVSPGLLETVQEALPTTAEPAR